MFTAVVATLAVAGLLPGQARTVPPDRGIPLVTGAVWVYKGTVKTWNADAQKSIAKTVTWQMKVVRAQKVGALTVAEMNGHPADVAWGVPEEGPSKYLYIRDAARTYQLNPEGPPLIPATEADARKMLQNEDVVFQLPLRVGQDYAADRGRRQSGRYCWHVVAVAPARLSGIKGLTTASAPGYTVTYRTNPDTETVDIAEGVGIVRFRYEHHGTPAECDLRLVEVKRPAK